LDRPRPWQEKGETGGRDPRIEVRGSTGRPFAGFHAGRHALAAPVASPSEEEPMPGTSDRDKTDHDKSDAYARSDKPEVIKAGSPGRRFADWFDLDLPDLFRWFDERRPSLFGSDDRMRVEEEIKDGALHVRAEVPGIDPEKDADVSVSDGMLRIRVERRREHRSEEEGHVRSEFRYGSFYRSIPLPKGADSSQVSASYKDGILEVTVPMPEQQQSQSQKISISRQ
jgi:HSP20 family protein